MMFRLGTQQKGTQQGSSKSYDVLVRKPARTALYSLHTLLSSYKKDLIVLWNISRFKVGVVPREYSLGLNNIETK